MVINDEPQVNPRFVLRSFFVKCRFTFILIPRYGDALKSLFTLINAEMELAYLRIKTTFCHLKFGSLQL